MIRIRAGDPRRALLRARNRAGLRVKDGTRVSRVDPPRIRRVLTLGLPTVWGAAAVTYKLVCPLAQQDGLGARIVDPGRVAALTQAADAAREERSRTAR